MPRLAPTALIPLILSIANCATAQTLKGRVWTHEQHGIKMTIPEGYASIPLQVDEKWISAKFLSDKTYLSKYSDGLAAHRGLMRIIIFTEKAKKGSATEVHKTDEGSTFIGVGAVPYQGYRNYVKRHRKDFIFSKEDETRIGGADSLMCEVKIHKARPKLHLYSVVIRQPTFEMAVEFEVLEDRLDKVKQNCLRALKSIRIKAPSNEASAPITHKGAKRTSTRLWTEFRSEWRKRPSLERDEIRKVMEQQHHVATRKATPDDWTTNESKHFLVISHANPKFTKQITNGAELFYKWCETEFGSLGEDYVRRPVLRLCKDSAEYRLLGSSSSTNWSLLVSDREIGTYYELGTGSSGQNISTLFPGILQHFLQERDPYIVSYTPDWLKWALTDYVRECHVSDRKLDFRVKNRALDGLVDLQGNYVLIRELLRNGKLPKLQELLGMNKVKFPKMRSSALRYVMGPGSRDKAFKNYLTRYFKTAIAVGEEYDNSNAITAKHTETEQEKEERAKAYATQSKARAKQLQNEINEKMLADINAKTWAKHETAFVKFVKKGR